MTDLVLLLLTLLAYNIEELQAVLALARAHHAQPISQLLLLEELLGQVLQIPAAEFLVRDNLYPAIAEVRDGDVITEVASAAVDFDALLEEGGEG